MSISDYKKVYEGSFILSSRIKNELELAGITPLIRDQGESNRLTGYPVSQNNFREVFVLNNDYENAFKIVNRVKAEMEASSQ